MTEARPAVILDRDGTLNREQGFVRSPDELVVLPGVAAAVARLAGAGFRLVVVTNQSGIARGLYGEVDLARIHESLHGQLGGQVHSWLHCPHFDGEGANGYARACACRKPKPGLLEQAARLFPIDWRRSFLVGDSARDLLMGHGLPVTKVLVQSGKPWREHLARLEAAGCAPDHVATDLAAAADWILATRPGDPGAPSPGTRTRREGRSP